MSAAQPQGRPSEGLWRTTLAGPGRSLADAFDSLERSAVVDQITRHTQRGIIAARVSLRPEEGEGYWELTRIRNDFFVVLCNFTYKDIRFEFVPGDGLLQFNFKISGDLNYLMSDQDLASNRSALRFNRPALHLWRQPVGLDIKEFTAPKAHEQMVAVSVRPEVLTRQLLDESGEIPLGLRQFLTQPGAAIDYCLLPLTAEMFSIIEKLLANPHQGALRLAYTEALITELICAAIVQARAEEGASTRTSDHEMKALRAARKMLTERTAAPLPLAGIARAVGLSDRRLRRHFKAVYGESPARFARRCRLQQARVLLEQRGWSVDRTSEALGYSQPTTFATAFKRHFGLRPVDLKRRRARSSD